MSDAQTPPDMGPRLQTLRILHGALCAGVAVFLVIVLVLRLAGGMNKPPPIPLITYVAAAFTLIMLMVSFALPTMMEANWRRQLAPGKSPFTGAQGAGMPADPFSRWAGLYQTRLIVRMALLEGAAFFALIAYLLEGQPLSLGLAGGLLFAMLGLFPTRAGIEAWVETQRSRMEQGG